VDTEGLVRQRLAVDAVVAAGPAAIDRRRYVLLLEHEIGETQCKAKHRLDLVVGTFDGRIPTGFVVDHEAKVGAPALAARPDGEIAVTLGDRLLRVGSSARRRRSYEPPGALPVSDTDGEEPPMPLAYLPDGRLIVAYSRARTVNVITLAAGTMRVVARQRLGRHRGLATIRVATAAIGRAVVAWSTQDAGEERNSPLTVRAAILEPGDTSFGTAQLLDAGKSNQDPSGKLQLALGRDGGAYAGWSNADGSRYPVRVAHAAPGAPFTAARELSDNGEFGDVAVTRRGTGLAVWVNDRTGRVMACELAPGGACHPSRGHLFGRRTGVLATRRQRPGDWPGARHMARRWRPARIADDCRAAAPVRPGGLPHRRPHAPGSAGETPLRRAGCSRSTDPLRNRRSEGRILSGA
jgi:hypothetical protein